MMRKLNAFKYSLRNYNKTKLDTFFFVAQLFLLFTEMIKAESRTAVHQCSKNTHKYLYTNKVFLITSKGLLSTCCTPNRNSNRTHPHSGHNSLRFANFIVS